MHDHAPWSLLCLFVLASITIPSETGATPSDDLTRLCDEYWQGMLRVNPTYATALGDHRYDDRLGDPTPAGIERERRRLEDLLARARTIDTSRLPDAERLTHSALVLEVRNQLDELSCQPEDWVVDPLGGPQIDFMNLVDYTRFEKAADGANFVARCPAMGPYLDAHVANLRSGLGKRRVAGTDQVRKVIDELDGMIEEPADALPLLKPLREPRAGWPAADRVAFDRDLTAVAKDVVKPALVRYRDFLRNDVMPKARPQEKEGLSFLPGGKECYEKRIRIQTSLDLSPDQLHQLGLDEVARFRRALSDLGAKALGTGDVAEIQRRLRSDPEMHFARAQEVESKAREALARAKATIPNWFGLLPEAGCEVKVMGLHESKNSTVAYYRQPTMDGSRPGYYMLNTYAPETRPRYEAEALAFHEAIPGHHLQIAIAQELSDLPEFRKYGGVTAYVEGWGLYAERLADEMGLYSGDLDRIGMLSYDAWRSCRLVVDTGLHALGWTRRQAIDYMMENTVLARNNIENEVDRYLTWPGQALAYKCGQLEILKLRAEAKRRLGGRFDIKQFHDVVLKNGAVALPVLRDQVESWIARQETVK